MSLIKPNIIEILNANDYIELFGEPDQQWDSEKQEVLEKWIKQAINQFDSLISPDNQAGALYDWWADLDLTNPKEQLKAQKLQYAICAWVEFIILTGKYWVDNVPTIQSNIPFNIKSASNNNEIENKRQDIINDLKTIGLLKTNNLTLNQESTQALNNNIDDLMVVSKEYIDSNYIKLKPQKPLEGNIDMGANNIQNVSNIYSSQPFNKGDLYNFQLKNCIVDKDDNNIINANSAQQAETILDPIDGIYKQINQFDANYFNGFTKEQIYELIHASGTDWNANLEYDINYIVCYIENGLMKFYKSKINDNIGHIPPNSPNEWEPLQNQPIDISGVMEQIKPHINKEIEKQLNALPTIDYVSEGASEILEFENQQDFENYKNAMNIDDSYFQDIQKEPTKDFAIRDKENTFTQVNTFNCPVVIENNDLTLFNSQNLVFMSENGNPNNYNTIKIKHLSIGSETLILENQIVSDDKSIPTKIWVEQAIAKNKPTINFVNINVPKSNINWVSTKYTNSTAQNGYFYTYMFKISETFLTNNNFDLNNYLEFATLNVVISSFNSNDAFNCKAIVRKQGFIFFEFEHLSSNDKWREILNNAHTIKAFWVKQ